MKLGKITMALIAGLAFTSGSTMMVRAQEGPPPGEWQPMEPPGNWSSAWHSGFHDGIQAARHDIDAHKDPDPSRHDTFRHPDRPRDERPDFRDGFRRGYQMEYDHFWHHHHDHDDHPDQ
ncbi:MAG: hypothetical protein WB622_12085 [Acidobacteriaceae bacterium]